MLLREFPQENGAFGYRQRLRAEMQHRFVELLAGFPSFQRTATKRGGLREDHGGVAIRNVPLGALCRPSRRCRAQPITCWNLAVFGQPTSGTPTPMLNPVPDSP